MSLAARLLEAARIPTVIIGSARDIVEECGVPRFLFTDFPLGNPVGRPGAVDMQQEILGMALELLESARFPRTTVQAPFVWNETDEWRQSYMQITRSDNDDQLR